MWTRFDEEEGDDQDEGEWTKETGLTLGCELTAWPEMCPDVELEEDVPQQDPEGVRIIHYRPPPREVPPFVPAPVQTYDGLLGMVLGIMVVVLLLATAMLTMGSSEVPAPSPVAAGD